MSDPSTSSGQALIARLEEATEESRELDGLIFRATHQDQEPAHWDKYGAEDAWCHQDPDDKIAWETPPHYTTSLDAALTLVPEGWWLHLEQCGGATGSGKSFWHAELFWSDGTDQDKKWGMNVVPALALCIACLRARGEPSR